MSINQCDFIGATKGTSGTSELYAEAWAAMLILQQGWRCGLTIEFDSKYAAGIADGKFSPKANKARASIVAGLFSMAMNQAPLLGNTLLPTQTIHGMRWRTHYVMLYLLQA